MVYAIVDGITLKIDKAGRIILPKPVRDRFHLREGSELEMEKRLDGLTLRPVQQRYSLVLKEGVGVHLGKVPRGFDWNGILDAERGARIKDTSRT
jgi:AbrB family looped-hinge helix DNA binding protein